MELPVKVEYVMLDTAILFPVNVEKFVVDTVRLDNVILDTFILDAFIVFPVMVKDDKFVVLIDDAFNVIVPMLLPVIEEYSSIPVLVTLLPSVFDVILAALKLEKFNTANERLETTIVEAESAEVVIEFPINPA